MKSYIGTRIDGICHVHVINVDAGKMSGSSRPLPPRLDLINHSPTGFEWGYGGSGPAQLALAMLCDAGFDDETAMRLHQRFKFRVVGGLAPTWCMSLKQVRAAVAKIESERK